MLPFYLSRICYYYRGLLEFKISNADVEEGRLEVENYLPTLSKIFDSSDIKDFIKGYSYLAASCARE